MKKCLAKKVRTSEKEPHKRALVTREARQGAAGARCGVRLWGAGEGVTVS